MINWPSFIVGFTIGALAALLVAVWVFLTAYNKVMGQTVNELKNAVDKTTGIR